MNILLIGNGVSRKDVNLSNLLIRFDISRSIGCNGIWRDFLPDNIVMWDVVPVIEFIGHIKEMEEGLAQAWLNRLIIPDYYDKHEVIHVAGRNSGAFAMLWAVKHCKPKKIFFIGYDYFIDAYDRGKNLYSYGKEPSYTLEDFYASARASNMGTFMRNNEDIEFNILTHDGVLLEKRIRDIPNIKRVPIYLSPPKSTEIALAMEVSNNSSYEAIPNNIVMWDVENRI